MFISSWSTLVTGDFGDEGLDGGFGGDFGVGSGSGFGEGGGNGGIGTNSNSDSRSSSSTFLLFSTSRWLARFTIALLENAAGSESSCSASLDRCKSGFLSFTFSKS